MIYLINFHFDGLLTPTMFSSLNKGYDHGFILCPIEYKNMYET